MSKRICYGVAVDIDDDSNITIAISDVKNTKREKIKILHGEKAKLVYGLLKDTKPTEDELISDNVILANMFKNAINARIEIRKKVNKNIKHKNRK